MGDMVLSLDLVPSWEDMALLEDMDLSEELVTELLEASATESLLEVARCPTSLCTSLCRARTEESPSPRLSDPLSLLLLTIPAPPTVSAPTGLDLLLSPPELPLLLLPMVLAMVLLVMALLEELATELLATVLLATVSATAWSVELVWEECSTDTLATTELPSSTLLSPVEKRKPRYIKNESKLASNIQNFKIYIS